MRRILSTIAATIILALTATFGAVACGNTTTYQSVCVQKITNKRVDDYRCQRGSFLYEWWYLSPGQYVPPLNSRTKEGTAKKPSGGKIRLGGQPKTGATATKKKSSGGSIFKNKSNTKSGSGSKSGSSRSGSSSRGK